MKERPILFNGEMVKAILGGRKTQTRRVLKVQPPLTDKNIMPLYTMEPEPKVTEVTMHEVMDDGMPFPSSLSRHNCPYGKIGDHLWVRESWYQKGTVGRSYPDDDEYQFFGHKQAAYVADGDAPKDWTFKKRPSIHMPRWASRILLEITNIRVERLNDISKADAIAEGVDKYHNSDFYVRYGFENDWCANAFASFAYLWESVYGKESWTANPWVWVLEFKVIEGGAV